MGSWGYVVRSIRATWENFLQITEKILLDGTAQSVRYGEVLRDRSGRPDDINSQEEARAQSFVIGNDETELELSVQSRSSVNRVNDQVRRRQNIISNVSGNVEEHFLIWWMFLAVTMEWAIFNGKNFQNNDSIANTTDLTLKQVFDISAKLVREQNEISGLETIGWEKHSWTYLSLIGDERIINLQRTKVYVFSDSVLCLWKIHQNPESNEAWKKRIEWITSSQSRDFDGIDGEPTKFEWNIFPGFDTLQVCDKVKSLLSKLGETSENFTGRMKFYFYVDVQRHFLWNKRQWTRKSVKRSTRIFVCKKIWSRTMVIHWSWFRKEEVFYERRQSTRNLGQIGGKMLIEFEESGHPTFRATTPLARCFLKSKGHGKLSIHFATVQETIETLFRISVCKSAQSLRSSGRSVWRIRNRSRQIGATWCGDGTVNCAQCDQYRSSFWRMMIQHIIFFYYNNRKNELRSYHNKMDTMYGCRISECCWDWTVFHD